MFSTAKLNRAAFADKEGLCYFCLRSKTPKASDMIGTPCDFITIKRCIDWKDCAGARVQFNVSR